MALNRSTAVGVLLVVFVGLLGYRSGALHRIGQAASGSLTIGGR